MAHEPKMVKARDLKVGQRVFLPADPVLGVEECRGIVYAEWESGFYYIHLGVEDDRYEVPADGDELVELIE